MMCAPNHRPVTELPRVAALIAFASALVVGGCQKSVNESTEATDEAKAASTVDSAKVTADTLVVYYFHGNKRCRTCKGIQEAIQDTIRERLAAEIGSGALVFHEVNIDEPTNAHFVKDFDVSSSSMVVVAKSGESTVKWENCPEIWPLAHQPDELRAYVEKQIKTYLQLVRRT